MKRRIMAGGALAMLLPLAAALAHGPAPAAPEPSAKEGSIVFQKYCVLCHGAKGDGTGAAASLYDPRPANLTISPYSDTYKETIVRNGGKAVGRSANMPAWGRELGDAQIRDVVAYLRTLKTPAARDAGLHGFLAPEGIGGDFELVDQHNRRFGMERLKGRRTLLFFGYASCPDACPTTLAEAAQVNRRLPKSQRLEVVFVTLDPERDTPDALQRYIGAFDAGFHALSGSRAEIERVADAYRVSLAKHAPKQAGGEYGVDHSAHLYLLDRRGKVVLMYPYGTPGDEIAGDVRMLIAAEQSRGRSSGGEIHVLP
jgi:protein SCO1